MRGEKRRKAPCPRFGSLLTNRDGLGGSGLCCLPGTDPDEELPGPPGPSFYRLVTPD